MPAGKPDYPMSVYPAAWRGIPLDIYHTPDRFCGMDHLEVMSEGRVPLPITDTGYVSQLAWPERLEQFGGPVEFVLAWLDDEAGRSDWKRREEEGRQLSLF